MALTGLINVAIVDDQRMFLDGLESWLTAADPRIRVVVKSQSYVGFLEELTGPIDVVIVDVDLKDDSTIEARVAEITARGMKVIVVSTFADATVVHRALAAGALGYASKSESASEIGFAIEAALSGRDYLTPHVTALLLQETQIRRPALSMQEKRVMSLYATGLPVKNVAFQMGLSQDTVRTYLKRIKAKYVECGIRLDTKIDFFKHSLQFRSVTVRKEEEPCHHFM
ncbi:response regulator transcription factor [Rathayibacter sp. AY1H3]|nr:response regulator transcription factor [Rathayibacter sp. AY1H3]